MKNNVKSFIYRHHRLAMFLAVAMMSSVTTVLAADPHPGGDNGGGEWHPFAPMMQVLTAAFLQAIRFLSK